jgi:hypothetical protein
VSSDRRRVIPERIAITDEIGIVRKFPAHREIEYPTTTQGVEATT